VYRWGKRLSGVTWSPGGAISFVHYDKMLEGRLRRDALRTLESPTELQGTLDDPWTFLEHLAEVWGYVMEQAPYADDAITNCATSASQMDVAWIRRVVHGADGNRSRWPIDPVWQLVQVAMFTDAPTKARRLMRRKQHVHAVEQLDVGAYGYLVSRTALLHRKGESFDISIGLRGLFQAPTKIAAQPGKDFGELVRQRRRKLGLPVSPVRKLLPFLPARGQDEASKRSAVDAAAEAILCDRAPHDTLLPARVNLAERRRTEALVALEDAERRGVAPGMRARLEAAYTQALEAYECMLRFTMQSTHPR
jgi:hypothetical protein